MCTITHLWKNSPGGFIFFHSSGFLFFHANWLVFYFAHRMRGGDEMNKRSRKKISCAFLTLMWRIRSPMSKNLKSSERVFLWLFQKVVLQNNTHSTRSRPIRYAKVFSIYRRKPKLFFDKIHIDCHK